MNWFIIGRISSPYLRRTVPRPYGTLEGSREFEQSDTPGRVAMRKAPGWGARQTVGVKVNAGRLMESVCQLSGSGSSAAAHAASLLAGLLVVGVLFELAE